MGYIDDYRAKINLLKSLTPTDYMLSEMKKQFKDYLQITPTRRVIKKDTIEYVADIQDVSEVNKNNNDEKYCITEFGLNIQIGDIISIDSFEMKQWIITEKENMTIEDRQRYKIRPCNISMKFISPIDKTTLHEVWCIKTNMSLYSIGVKENKYFISEDGKRFITASYNDITKEIYSGQRFILDSETDVFEVTEIYKNNGILEIKMGQTDKIPDKDRFDLGLAYNDGINIIQPPITPDYSIQIIGDSEIQQGYSKQYQAKVYNNGIEVVEPVIWSIDNPTNASIIPNGNSCLVQGLIQGEYVILTAKLAQDNSVLITKDIYIGGGW